MIDCSHHVVSFGQVVPVRGGTEMVTERPVRACARTGPETPHVMVLVIAGPAACGADPPGTLAAIVGRPAATGMHCHGSYAARGVVGVLCALLCDQPKERPVDLSVPAYRSAEAWRVCCVDRSCWPAAARPS